MSRLSPSRLALSLTALVAAGSLVLAGCGDDDDDAATTATSTTAGATAEPAAATQPNVVTITAADFSFTLPKQIPAGLTEIKLENQGTEPHQAGLVLLEEGATPEQFLGALAADFSSAAQFGTFIAGPNEAAPSGGSSSVVSDLAPGNYLVLCLIPSPDGTPHVLKGMQAPLEVMPPAGDADAAVDPDAPTLTLQDFSFDLPDDYDGGPLNIVNNGPQNHEVAIVGLPDGVEISDIVDSAVPLFTPAKGPQPFTDAAGTTIIAPGGKTFIDPQLPAGRYAMVCFLPDTTKANTDHLHNGMATEFTVS